MGVLAGGLEVAAEHAREFIDALGAVEFADLGNGAGVLGGFGDEEMGGGEGGDRSEVSDTEDLAIFSDAEHFLADDRGRGAADIGIDFVENEDGDLVLSGENGFEGEHDTGDFAGRRDGAEGARWFTWVWREEELDGVETGGREVGLGNGG